MDEGNKKQTPATGASESEATSKETLEDIEDSEKSSAGNEDERSDSVGPSPDGAFDHQKKNDDAGPM